jgi:hypothetical protein
MRAAGAPSSALTPSGESISPGPAPVTASGCVRARRIHSSIRRFQAKRRERPDRSPQRRSRASPRATLQSALQRRGQCRGDRPGASARGRPPGTAPVHSRADASRSAPPGCPDRSAGSPHLVGREAGGHVSLAGDAQLMSTHRERVGCLVQIQPVRRADNRKPVATRV